MLGGGALTVVGALFLAVTTFACALAHANSPAGVGDLIRAKFRALLISMVSRSGGEESFSLRAGG